MVHDLLQVLGVEGVEEVEKIFPRGPFIFRIGRGEVPHELGILFEFGPEPSHRKFIVMGDLDMFDRGLLHEVLLAGEDLLEEVLVDHGLVGQIVLDYKEIRHEGRRHLRCLSKYWMKSAFDLSFHDSSSAVR